MSRLWPIAQALLRSLWFFFVPALLAMNWVRYGALSPYSDNATGAGRALGREISESPFVAGVLLFLVVALLLRYWRFQLPGGRALAELPPSLSSRLKLSELAEGEAAYGLLKSLRTARARKRHEQLSELERCDLETSIAALEQALLEGDIGRLRVQVEQLTRSSAHVLAPARRWLALRGAVLLAFAAAAALLLRAYGLQSYRVLSSSMLPTLQTGDLIVGSRVTHRPALSGGAVQMPRRGEVIVFRRAGKKSHDDLVKRVIGLPGDVIDMKEGFPKINGWPVPHCDAGRYAEALKDGEFDGRIMVEFLGDQVYLTSYSPMGQLAEDYRVREGEVFVMGDNRTGSLDSRFWNDGKPAGLPIVDVEAKVVRRLSQARRDGTPDFSSSFKPLGLDIYSPGVDLTRLQAGVQRCLANRPKQTEPPTVSIEPT